MVPTDSFPGEIFKFKHNTARTTTYNVRFAYRVSFISPLVIVLTPE